TMIAATMKLTGEHEWPGQLISLASIALAAAILFAALARRLGGLAAYVGLLAMLSAHGVVVVATSIQPDPLAFLAYTIGLVAFMAWLSQGADGPASRRLWIAWVAATAIAGLIKPTTLELGLTQGVLVLLTRPAALRRPSLWIGWAIVIAAVGAF